jgi:hypothetical protein
MKSVTRLPTANGSKYLQQLCKHWSHKFAVEFDTTRGVIPFSDDRRSTLSADPEALSVEVEAGSEADLVRLQGVVIEHLNRFAFREPFSDVQWRAG